MKLSESIVAKASERCFDLYGTEARYVWEIKTRYPSLEHGFITVEADVYVGPSGNMRLTITDAVKRGFMPRYARSLGYRQLFALWPDSTQDDHQPWLAIEIMKYCAAVVEARKTVSQYANDYLRRVLAHLYRIRHRCCKDYDPCWDTAMAAARILGFRLIP